MNKKKLKEKNPLKRFYRERVWKWDEILGKRFFSHSVGYFTVKKIWSCYRYCPYALTPDLKSHWFQHYTMEIKTEHGEKLIVRKLPFDLEHCFDKN